MKLKNAQHECFCQEYIIDFNRTRAAKDSGYSAKTARVQGCQLLTKLNIQERIAELLKDRSERTKITQDMVLEELRILAFSDFRNYGEIVSQYGIDRLRLNTFDKIKGNATRAIKSISEKVTKDGVHLSFKLHGKTPAIELLGKHLGMFLDKIEHSGNIGLPLFIMPRPKEKGAKKKDDAD